MSRAIEIKQSQDRLITPSGVMLVGALLARTSLGKLVNRIGKLREAGHQNMSCIFSYIAMLCQGKSSYEDICEMHKEPSFYCQSLHINTIPSAETLRQRMDILGEQIAKSDMVMEESAKMIKAAGLEPTPCFSGHIPLDIDVCVHDNSQTKKEGVEWTYKGVHGYAPIYAYIGEEGYACNVKLRAGSCHSQCEGTVDFLSETLRLARQVTEKQLLVRMDSGNDALDNIKLFTKENVDYIIKRNLRKEDLFDWELEAKIEGEKREPREGKTVYTGSVHRDRGLETPLRIVYCVTERKSLPNGQILICPDVEVQTWWTSLDCGDEDVIRLYREHSTSEQFHSEIKTDIGLERFPSGKFDTNAAILKLAALAYNILRIIGQSALNLEKLTRHDVKRLRATTVIKRFMFIAGRIITHARQIFLTLGRSNIWSDVFTRLYSTFG